MCGQDPAQQLSKAWASEGQFSIFLKYFLTCCLLPSQGCERNTHRNAYRHRALIQDFYFLFVTAALPRAAACRGPCTRPFLLRPTVPLLSSVRWARRSLPLFGDGFWSQMTGLDSSRTSAAYLLVTLDGRLSLSEPQLFPLRSGGLRDTKLVKCLGRVLPQQALQ